MIFLWSSAFSLRNRGAGEDALAGRFGSGMGAKGCVRGFKHRHRLTGRAFRFFQSNKQQDELEMSLLSQTRQPTRAAAVQGIGADGESRGGEAGGGSCVCRCSRYSGRDLHGTGSTQHRPAEGPVRAVRWELDRASWTGKHPLAFLACRIIHVNGSGWGSLRTMAFLRERRASYLGKGTPWQRWDLKPRASQHQLLHRSQSRP